MQHRGCLLPCSTATGHGSGVCNGSPAATEHSDRPCQRRLQPPAATQPPLGCGSGPATLQLRRLLQCNFTAGVTEASSQHRGAGGPAMLHRSSGDPRRCSNATPPQHRRPSDAPSQQRRPPAMFHCNSTTTPAVLQAAAGNRCSQDLRWRLLRSGLSLLPKMLWGRRACCDVGVRTDGRD